MSARARAWLACGLVLASARGQAQASFGASIEYVQVDVLVSRDGRPVTGLEAANFEVYDAGVRRAVELIGVERASANVLLALDVSQSVQGARLLALQDAAAVLLRGLQGRDRAALLAFNHAIELRAPLGAPDEAERALRALRPHGATSLFDGLYATLGVANAQDQPSVVVLFTDGLDTMSWLSSEDVAQTARRSSATLYVVATGATPRVLKKLSHDSGGRVFSVGWQGLADAFGHILDEVRQRYRLRFEPGPGPSGWRALDVRLRGARGEVQARRGYVRAHPH